MIKCPNCNGEIKEGSAFCTHCGSKLDIAMKKDKEKSKEKSVKKEKKVEEEVVVEVKPVVDEIVPVQNNNVPVPKKKGKGKVIFLTFLFLVLVAAIVVLTILLLKKDDNKSEKNGNTSSSEEKLVIKGDRTKTDNSIVGEWEHTIMLKDSEEDFPGLYEHFIFDKDGTFIYEKHMLGNKSQGYSLEGNYKEKNSGKVILSYEEDEEESEVTLFIDDGKLCIQEINCDTYYVKKGSGKNSILTFDKSYFGLDDDDNDNDDDNDDNDDDDDYNYSDDGKIEISNKITIIDYYDYKEMLREKESFVLVAILDENCSYCEEFNPVVEKLADKYLTPIYYIKADDRLEVKGYPTSIIVIDGKVKDQIIGNQSYDKMVKIFEEYDLY